MRILLFGKTGQVGWELERTLAPVGEIVALGRTEADFSRPEVLRGVVRDVKPEVIVNAAAYTDVDRAEAEPDLAMTVNGVAPGVLAEEARRLGSVLIHYSTDYVFDGAKGSPYTENDEPDPINVYGKSKLAGEEAIRAVGGAYLILRTSWVYSLRRDCFVTKVLRWARERDTLRVVEDQVSSPTWARLLAEATAVLMTKVDGHLLPHLVGVYHAAAEGFATRFRWAQAILRYEPSPTGQGTPSLLPASTSDFASPAERPAFSALDCTRVCKEFGLVLPQWEIGLRLAMEGLASSP